jgi:hypothetical protein
MPVSELDTNVETIKTRVANKIALVHKRSLDGTDIEMRWQNMHVDASLFNLIYTNTTNAVRCNRRYTPSAPGATIARTSSFACPRTQRLRHSLALSTLSNCWNSSQKICFIISSGIESTQGHQLPGQFCCSDEVLCPRPVAGASEN